MARCGTDLSSGQWQRLALARAYLRDAQIVALDEPTAALDPRAEVEFYRQFAQVAAGRTAVLVSHRLGAARLGDRIVVLAHGRIVEEGNHEDSAAPRRRLRAHVRPASALVRRAAQCGGRLMSTEPNTTTGSWQRLKYVPPTLRPPVRGRCQRNCPAFHAKCIVMGLFPLAEVHVLRRLIETAEQIVAGSAPVANGLVWGLALALLAILHAAVVHVREIVDRRHQEVLGNYLEERCLQQAQSMPLEWFEHDKHYDLLHLVRRRTVGRLGATTSFLTRSVSDIVTMASLLIYLGQFHWGLPLLLALGTTPGALLRESIHRQRYLMDRAQAPDERRFGVYIDLLTGRHAAAEIRLFNLGKWLLDQAGQLRRRLQKERLQLSAREARHHSSFRRHERPDARCGPRPERRSPRQRPHQHRRGSSPLCGHRDLSKSHTLV